jgi:hypothetical protein
MTCPKCLSHRAEPTMSWTISGRKLTIPSVYLWACANPNCRHQWPRELSSPSHEVAQDSLLGPTPSVTSPQAPSQAA